MSDIDRDLGDEWPKKLYPHGGGREWSTSTHGDVWKEPAGFEVVPASQLRGAVKERDELRVAIATYERVNADLRRQIAASDDAARDHFDQERGQ